MSIFLALAASASAEPLATPSLAHALLGAALFPTNATIFANHRQLKGKAKTPRAASGAMGVLVDASNVVTELRAGTPVDVGSLLRIGDVVVAVDGVVLGERRLKVVMAEVAKADAHTFTVRRL